MQLISKEIDGSEYKYCPERKAYLKFSAKGVLEGSLPEEYVPDPVLLWRKKAEAAGFMAEDGTVSFEDPRVLVLKPTPTVWKIWEHHNADSDN